MCCVLSSVLTLGVRFQFLGSMDFLFGSLWRTVRETLRLNSPAAAFLLSSMQLWLLAMAPLGGRPFDVLRRLKMFLGSLSDGNIQGRHPGLFRSEVLLEVVEVRVWGRAGYSGDGRWLDSKPEEDLLMDEDVFLSLPEINK